MRICIICDKVCLYEKFISIVQENYEEYVFDYFYTLGNQEFESLYKNEIHPICLKKVGNEFLERYDLFFSLHCKQIFPREIVNNYRCINIHPGYNPYNRGWYPHVFSIINGYPVGVTIHEMDEEIDHGPIICQRKVQIKDYDTAKEVYDKILQAEYELLSQNLRRILEHKYSVYMPLTGNINRKKDFENLCQINLDEYGTYRDLLTILRATSSGDYKNAWFMGEDGRKVYIKLILESDLKNM